MLRKMCSWLALAWLCGLTSVAVSRGADAPPQTAEKRETLLYVRTDPPGAKVLLNGKELGTSDGVFRVEPGSGTLFLEVQGHKAGEREVLIRANAVTRVELSLKPPAEAEAEGTRYIAHFPQGTVELLGLTSYPAGKQSSWWKPDGSPTTLGPFEGQPTQWSLSASKKPVAILLRTENLPPDTSWPVWKIAPSSGSWGSTGVVNSGGEVLRNYILFCAEPGPTAETANFSVGVDAGPWDTVITQKADNLGTASFTRDGLECTVKFLKAEVTGRMVDDSTRVRLTATDAYGRWRRRLVAITSDGSEHAAEIGSIGENGTAIFDHVALSSIQEFRYQVRSYQWVEFKNLSLQPGKKTDVEVVSGNAQAESGQAAKPEASDTTPKP